MPLSFYYFKDRIPSPISPPPPPGPWNADDGTPNDPPVLPLTDATNPIYNFSQDFIEKFQAIPPERLAKAVPYISVATLDMAGEVVTDFNAKFFSATVNMNEVSSQARYADRPELSLGGLTISEDLAAGGGHLSYTKVTMTFKLHKPDFITNNALISLLFSGMPVRIAYGWAPVDAEDDFLGIIDILLCNVVDYSIDIDDSGQATLTINCLSHSDNFSNVFVGDRAEEITVADVTNAAGDGAVTDEMQDGAYQQKIRVGQYVTYINSQDPSRTEQEGQRSIELLNAMAQAYYDVSDRVSVKVRLNYQQAMARLARRTKSRPGLFKDVKRTKVDGTVSYADCVSLHDIMGTLCGETLTALEGTIFPSTREYKFVYGCYNENAGSYAGMCISNFPVHWRSFTTMLDDAAAAGVRVPSLQFLFRKLQDLFLNDSTYWRDNLLRDEPLDGVELPRIAIRINSYYATDTAGPSGQRREVIQISVFDASRNAPLTQVRLQNVSSPMSEAQQIAAVVGSPPTVPVLRTGHANSFVKRLRMQNLGDPAFKAVLINRAINSVTTQRQAVIAGAQAPMYVRKPTFIPFKGSMEVVGHTEWKPSRFFYLASGIFFIDGVYSIVSVQHRLDAAGFKTHLEFTRH
jgi:hypothetical protein